MFVDQLVLYMFHVVLFSEFLYQPLAFQRPPPVYDVYRDALVPPCCLHVPCRSQLTKVSSLGICRPPRIHKLPPSPVSASFFMFSTSKHQSTIFTDPSQSHEPLFSSSLHLDTLSQASKTPHSHSYLQKIHKTHKPYHFLGRNKHTYTHTLHFHFHVGI